MENVRAKIARSIKTARVNIGLTQREVCFYTDISEDTIYKYESGRRAIPIEKLRLLCIVLNLSLDKILELNKK